MRSAALVSGVLATVGLALTALASGTVLRGSSVVTVPDAAVFAGSPVVPSGSSARNAPAPGAPEHAPLPLGPGDIGIAPAAAQRVRIPAIDVDAPVLPIDSTPTGATNRWGGEIYEPIDFPVDGNARQWVRRGDPNSLPADGSATDPRASDRVVIYGHASDIGRHLVFQDLAAVAPGDNIIVATELGEFTYVVTKTYLRNETNLTNLAALYEYPMGGVKEIALVACLPDSTSNVVVIGELLGADAVTTAPAP